MPDLLVRNLDPVVLDRLKGRAKRHGRSLQAEAKLLLEQASGGDNVQALLDSWDERFAGRQFASSVDLLREDRDR